MSYRLTDNPVSRLLSIPPAARLMLSRVAIGHKSDRAIIDLVRAWDPPFNPKVVTGEIAEVLKGYGVLNITGDSTPANGR